MAIRCARPPGGHTHAGKRALSCGRKTATQALDFLILAIAREGRHLLIGHPVNCSRTAGKSIAPGIFFGAVAVLADGAERPQRGFAPKRCFPATWAQVADSRYKTASIQPRRLFAGRTTRSGSSRWHWTDLAGAVKASDGSITISCPQRVTTVHMLRSCAAYCFSLSLKTFLSGGRQDRAQGVALGGAGPGTNSHRHRLLQRSRSVHQLK